MTVEPKTLIEMLQSAAAQPSGKPVYRFLTDGNPDGPCQTLSARDLEADAERIGAALAAMIPGGPSEKPRVVIACLSPLDFARAFFGCLFAGVIPVPVDPPPARPTTARLQLLRSILSDARPMGVITDASNLDGMSKAVQNGHGPSLPLYTVEGLEAQGIRLEPRTSFPNDTALLQYTSGSTASPRGVIISHENLLSNLKSIQAVMQPPPHPVGVCWLPLSHDMGLVGNLLLNLRVGGELVLMTPRAFVESPLQWLRTICRFRAWGTCAPNFAFAMCNRAIRKVEAEQLDLSSLDALLCGAEPIDSGTLEHFLRRFEPQGLRREALRPCYGLAEATLFVSMSRPEGLSIKTFDPATLSKGSLREAASPSEGRRIVSCGEVQPDLEAIVVDPASRRRLNDGEVGEIWISGQSVARGYFGWPDTRCKDVFRLEIEGTHHRYLRTGDLGALYEGEIYLTGRSKDLVIVHGKNYDAHDLERIAVGAHPSLRSGNVAVLADLEQGERVNVIVEAPPGAGNSEFPLLARRIRAKLAENSGIQPHRVMIVPPKSIAFTPSGKMRRRETFRLLNSGVIKPMFVHDAPDASNEAAGVLDGARIDGILQGALMREIRFAARLGERDRISLDTRLSELGIDSLGIVQITTSLREVMGREIPLEIVDNNPTLSEILERLRNPPACSSGAGSKPLGANGTPVHTNGAGPVEQPMLNLGSRHALREAVFDDVFEPARRFGLLTSAQQPDGMPFYRAFTDWEGTHARLDERRILILSSFDYLGLATDPRVREAAMRAAQDFGTGRSGARIHAGTTPEILAMENKIARFVGREDALICTTGYQAMIGVVTAFMNSRTTLVVDEAVHASILDGAAISRCRLVRFRHNDCEDLNAVLSETRSAMVMVEGLYSNNGDLPPLPEIREACSRHRARLALDEAHGLGTLGTSGRGAEEHFGCLGASDIIAGTFSKSLCSIGGWIAGDRDVIEYVRYHGRSVLFTAAISPPMVAAAAAALEILMEQPERVAQVRRNADLLRRHLRKQAVPLTGEHGPLIRIPIRGELPCLSLAGELLRRGIFVQPVLHPSVPRDEAMIRLCVSAAHDPGELRWAAEEFAALYHTVAGPRPEEFQPSASNS